jgi:anti-sigma regulatory factor (Ser/Thr protein kinase)/anti-anti-sigma regulatory factor
VDARIELAPGERHGGAAALLCAVTLRGTLSEATAPDLVAALADLVRRRSPVVADVSGLTLAHPGAVSALAEAFAQAGEWPDVRLALVAPVPAVAAALADSGVADRVPVYTDEDDAVAHLDTRPALTSAFWHFTVTPRAPATARGHVRRVCRRWDVDDDTREAAEIVVTELVTNAVEHARSASVVEVERRRHAFRLTVRDYDRATLPDATLPDPTSPRGRGLAMVAAVAQSWGVDAHDDGKTVWAEMVAP